MMTIIKMQINHNLVNREPLFQTLEQLDSEDFLKKTGAGRGSIRDILIHLMDAERYWIATLRDTKIEKSKSEDFQDIQSIRSAWSRIAIDTEEFIRNLADEELQHVKSVRWGDQTVRFTGAKVLVHMATHETHHRGFLIGLIRQLGLEPPDVNML